MTTRNVHHYPGVKWDRHRKRYSATLKLCGVHVVLGYYPEENAAYAARGTARRALVDAGLGDLIGRDRIPNRGRRTERRPQ